MRNFCAKFCHLLKTVSSHCITLLHNSTNFRRHLLYINQMNPSKYLKVSKWVLAEINRKRILGHVPLTPPPLQKKSPTVPNLWQEGHENCRLIEEKCYSKGFVYEDSPILISLVVYQLKAPGRRCRSGLFINGHSLRHRVTVLHVQHSLCCKYNKTCWRTAEYTGAHCCLFSASCFHLICFGFL